MGHQEYTMNLLKFINPLMILFFLVTPSVNANYEYVPGRLEGSEPDIPQQDISNIEVINQLNKLSGAEDLTLMRSVITNFSDPIVYDIVVDQTTLSNLAMLNHLLNLYQNNPILTEDVKKLIESIFLSLTYDSINKTTEGDLDGENHPCYRRCVAGKTMICRYNFTLEAYQSMSKACYNCPLNLTDCSRKDCIPGDGISRSISVVNRKLPGPKIEVCVGDTVIVNVHNNLLDEGTSVHWHGQHQKKTPFMDGVPFVTQCPIAAGNTFQYKFIAEHTGTHFWHSHSGMQRTDGDMGSLIVREMNPYHKRLYNLDLSEHVMIINDWGHTPGKNAFTRAYHAGGSFSPNNLLINGKGRFAPFFANRTVYTPVARFNVMKGFSYRFRVINAEFMVCPVELSIVGHNMTIISTDGNDVLPVEASSFVSYAGERFDFVLNASQDIGNYFMMFRGLLNCARNNISQVAVLHYDGAPNNEPEVVPTWNEAFREGLQVNGVNIGFGVTNNLQIPDLTSVEQDDIALKPIPDMKFYIGYDFKHLNGEFHKLPHYGYLQVPRNLRASVPQFNKISMKLPSSPMLPNNWRGTPVLKTCNENTVTNCDKEVCSCTHVINVPLNRVVELVIVDEGQPFDSNHPMHLHGYTFRVIGMDRLGTNTTVAAVKALDSQGRLKRRLNAAPVKDTVTVPDGGYTIVRFYANNPGYWLFHCHIEFHAEVGMALVFKVGENWNMISQPSNFPTCGDYVPS